MEQSLRFWTTLVAAIIGIAMMASVAQAKDVTLEWDAEALAVSYRIDTSVDAGVTWVLGVATVAAPDTTASVTIDDGVLVLLRAVAINAEGKEAVNYSSGVFHHTGWELPPAVVGLGIGD